MKKNLVPAISNKDVLGGILTDIEIASFKKSSCHKLSKDVLVKTILSFINNNTILKADKELFDMIIKDDAILNKLQICTDGSYVNGRIFYKDFFSNWDSNIQIDGRFWSEYYSKHGKSLNTLAKINYMKDNFKVIYLHLVNDLEALEDKEWSDEMDRMDYYYEESIR